MTNRWFVSLFALVSATGMTTAPVRAGISDDVIARARAFVAKEEALASLKSLRYEGSIDDGGKVTMVEIIFKKDYFQKVTVKHPPGPDNAQSLTEITGLDDTEAWRKDNMDGERIVILDASQVKRQQASVWENLNFYAGIEKVGGHVEYLGKTTIGDKSVDKLAFVHPEAGTFTRYFDTTTGQLLKTDIDNGTGIREEGAIVINGIRFPQKLISTQGEKTITINIQAVHVNENFDRNTFSVPLMLFSH